MRIAIPLSVLAVLAPAAAHGQPAMPGAEGAKNAFEEARAACEADGGELWGVSLCGSILLADTLSGRIFGNQPDSAGVLAPRGGVYAGSLPPGFPRANTSFAWGGTEWAVVMLPLPAARIERVDLLMHESFHRIQDELGLAMKDAPNAHLEEPEGRIWLRLEARALAEALRADSAGARRATLDGLLFRARRHGAYPEAAASEAALDIQEGLPSYTGVVLAAPSSEEAAARAAGGLAALEARDSYARSFAYATGPALGLLADRFAPGWRRSIRERRDLAALLADALGFEPPASVAETAARRAEAYGLAEVATAEEARRVAAVRRLEAYRERLVRGPVLVLPLREMQMTFDPNAVVPLGDDGTVYPTITLSDRWGALTVRAGGARIATDFTAAFVAAPTGGCQAEGGGWSLQLRRGWSVRPGARPGDCGVAEHL